MPALRYRCHFKEFVCAPPALPALRNGLHAGRRVLQRRNGDQLRHRLCALFITTAADLAAGLAFRTSRDHSRFSGLRRNPGAHLPLFTVPVAGLLLRGHV